MNPPAREWAVSKFGVRITVIHGLPRARHDEKKMQDTAPINQNTTHWTIAPQEIAKWPNVYCFVVSSLALPPCIRVGSHPDAS